YRGPEGVSPVRRRRRATTTPLALLLTPGTAPRLRRLALPPGRSASGRERPGKVPRREPSGPGRTGPSRRPRGASRTLRRMAGGGPTHLSRGFLRRDPHVTGPCVDPPYRDGFSASPASQSVPSP